MSSPARTDTLFEIEINESGTRLTITVHAGREMTPEEFAAELSDFVEDLRAGDAEIVIVPDSDVH